MKTDALTLRLSPDLARALRRLAKLKGVPKSQVVREAVAEYVSPSGPTPAAQEISARALALSWPKIPRLTPEEASAFEIEIGNAREGLVLPPAAWE